MTHGRFPCVHAHWAVADVIANSKLEPFIFCKNVPYLGIKRFNVQFEQLLCITYNSLGVAQEY